MTFETASGLLDPARPPRTRLRALALPFVAHALTDLGMAFFLFYMTRVIVLPS